MYNKLNPVAQRARSLGEAIYAHYSERYKFIDIQVFQDAVGFGLAADVQQKFDPTNLGELSKEMLIELCIQFWRERKNVQRSLDDIDSITDALGSFLHVGVAVIMFFVLTVIFSQGDFAELTVSLGTTLFAFSFVFAETAANTFSSFTFLFIRFGCMDSQQQLT